MAEPIIMGEKPFNLGKATGEAISDTFNQRMQQNMQISAQLKMADMMHRLGVAQQQQEAQRTAQGMQAYGMPEQQAKAMQYLNPTTQQAAFKEWLQQPRAAALGNFYQNALDQRNRQYLGGNQGQQTGMPVDQQTGMPAEQQGNMFAGMGPKEIEKAGSMLLHQQDIDIAETGKTRRHDQDLADKQKARDEGKSEKQIEREVAEKKFFDTKLEPRFNADQERAKAAEESNQVLDSMLDLIDKGDLPGPALVSLVEGFAKVPVLGNLISPNAILGKTYEELKKMSVTLMKGASKITGGRVPVAEWNTLLQTIPNALNSPEAMKSISKIVKAFNNEDIERARIEREIKDSNGGYIPKDFDSQVDKIMKPYREKIGNDIRDIIKEVETITDMAIGSRVEKLPDAATHKGYSFEDDNGDTLTSDGITWVKAGKGA